MLNYITIYATIVEILMLQIEWLLEIKMPKSFTKFRFDGAGVEMLYNIVNKKTGLLINKYPRGLLNMEIKEKMNNLKRIL